MAAEYTWTPPRYHVLNPPTMLSSVVQHNSEFHCDFFRTAKWFIYHHFPLVRCLIRFYAQVPRWFCGSRSVRRSNLSLLAVVCVQIFLTFTPRLTLLQTSRAAKRVLRPCFIHSRNCKSIFHAFSAPTISYPRIFMVPSSHRPRPC